MVAWGHKRIEYDKVEPLSLFAVIVTDCISPLSLGKCVVNY
jgi:hypothetical protein